MVVDGLCDACRANQVVFDEDLNTTFRVVSFSGHYDFLHQLLAAGADLNSVNAVGKTTILCAAEICIEQTVRLLIGAGAGVNIAARNDETALIAAAKGGHYDCFYQLLTAGADVNSVNAVGKTTQKVVFIRLLNYLIKSGADVNAAAGNGETALMAAAKDSHSKCLTLLLAAGADVNGVEYDGRTILIMAVHRCIDVIVGLLIEN